MRVHRLGGRGLFVVLVSLALAAAACADDDSRPELASPDTTKDVVVPSTTLAAGITTITAATLLDVSLVAAAVVPEVAVYDTPDSPTSRLSLANPIASGGPLVFLVDEQIEGWIEVLLPLRPNGSTGWIRASDATLTQHQFRIEVHLAEFRLDVYQGGEPVFSATVGVARDNAPTPGGRYYVTELLQPPEPDSPYGTFAYGLSGYSDVFETFNGGAGQLGIHGTNDPSTIGQQVSSGCVRLRNEDIEQIVRYLPLGTPVEIIA